MNRLSQNTLPSAPEAAAEALTVTAFTRRVKALLEGGLPTCWVRGEISNLRRQASGHVYFTLKDAGSQLSCVLFRGDAARQDFQPDNGMQVIVCGAVSVYEPRGNYQLICRQVVPDGLGRLQRDFEILKRKLQEEGLFDPSLKRPIPSLPAVVGFVTSPTGAAIRDFIGILQRRNWRGTVRIFPVRVQGTEAAAEIAAMIGLANRIRGADLLVVGRGGGSLEDLWPFNEAIVVRAIAGCDIPVISAVGHEIDVTLADFAADQRAETPSAAAELISSRYLECCERVKQSGVDLARNFASALRHHRRETDHLGHRLLQLHPQRGLNQAAQKLDDCIMRLQTRAHSHLSTKHDALRQIREALRAHTPQTRLQIGKAALEHYRARWQNAGRQALKSHDKCLGDLARRLQSGSLPSILQRGFVVVRNSRGEVVARKAALAKGQNIALDFSDGEIHARVD